MSVFTAIALDADRRLDPPSEASSCDPLNCSICGDLYTPTEGETFELNSDKHLFVCSQCTEPLKLEIETQDAIHRGEPISELDEIFMEWAKVNV